VLGVNGPRALAAMPDGTVAPTPRAEPDPVTAAEAALRRCRFTPGERNGERVPVRVRGFEIRFFLQGSD
jgi:hypothetical protein